MNTTIHPNDLFAPFTPDPDGKSWALTTDSDGNILPASHDGPGVAIWCIRIIGERTYAITRQVWDCPAKTVYRGRIPSRRFFALLMSNFENPTKNPPSTSISKMPKNADSSSFGNSTSGSFE